MRKLTGEDYDSFVEEFRNGISRSFSDVCFYLYGSYPRKRYIPGVSDIDGGIIFPEGPVTSKKKVSKISELIKNALDGRDIRLQWNPLSSNDGPFLSYDKSYTDYIKSEGVVVAGQDYRTHLNGSSGRQEEIRTISMNLRKMRNSLLMGSVNWGRDYLQRGSAHHSLEKSIDHLVSLPKRLEFA